jgi:hypothetical protein
MIVFIIAQSSACGNLIPDIQWIQWTLTEYSMFHLRRNPNDSGIFKALVTSVYIYCVFFHLIGRTYRTVRQRTCFPSQTLPCVRNVTSRCIVLLGTSLSGCILLNASWTGGDVFDVMFKNEHIFCSWTRCVRAPDLSSGLLAMFTLTSLLRGVRVLHGSWTWL